jgi:hypothetical protein
MGGKRESNFDIINGWGNTMWDNEEKSSDGDVGLPKCKSENGTDGTSAKQVAANRRNAMRSTGPRTPRGKEISKFNATKHGLRAAEIVIPGQEDPLEFEALLQELCDEWMPNGRTEISLVEEIALDQWRLRRAHRAELGEIRNGIMAAVTRHPLEEVYQKDPLVSIPGFLRKSSIGIGDLKSTVQVAMRELNAEGTISRKTCDMLDQMFGKNGDNPAPMLRIWFLGETPDWPPKYALRNGIEPDKKVAARAHLEICLVDLERLQRKLRQQESRGREIELQRLCIPNGPQLERLQRYETSIKRGMYRAMDQLERLQRRRRGEPPPPTVNVNVSSDDDD